MDQHMDETALAAGLRVALQDRAEVRTVLGHDGELYTVVRTPSKRHQFSLARYAPETAADRPQFLRDLASSIT